MPAEFEIFVGDMSDVEGHVYVRYIGPRSEAGQAMAAEPIVLRGTLRGPYCALANTLPAEFAFRDLGPQQRGLARAVVPDPCTWSPELPQLYQVDVEVLQGARVIAEHHGKVGLRRKGASRT